jgi:hypothetical protein
VNVVIRMTHSIIIELTGKGKGCVRPDISLALSILPHGRMARWGALFIIIDATIHSLERHVVIIGRRLLFSAGNLHATTDFCIESQYIQKMDSPK